jgi:hypothetical protein
VRNSGSEGIFPRYIKSVEMYSSDGGRLLSSRFMSFQTQERIYVIIKCSVSANSEEATIYELNDEY